MYWYFIGAVLCTAGAGYLKKKYKGYRKRYQALLVLAGGFLLAFFLGAADEAEKGAASVSRNAPGEGSEEKNYLVSAQGLLEEYPVNITVEEEKYGEQQKQDILLKAREELEQQVLGKNKSKDEIRSDLNLPDTLQNGAVEAEYTFSDYEIFNPDGKIRALPQEPVLTGLSVSMECQGEILLYEFYLRAVPEKMDEKQEFAAQIKESAEKENKKTNEKELLLPKEIEGRELSWKEQKESRSLPFLLTAAGAAICVMLSEKEKQKKDQKVRERQMLLDYPDIVGKLTLLMGAGMNTGTAWEKIAVSYRKKQEEHGTELRYAYEEMLQTLYEIQEGVGELRAYENFGTRCGITEYRKLSAMLVQNMRKGNKGMCQLLETEEREAWEKRKARAKEAGEEAGTKLLLPMGLMLIVVLAILMIPAGMSLNIS